MICFLPTFGGLYFGQYPTCIGFIPPPPPPAPTTDAGGAFDHPYRRTRSRIEIERQRFPVESEDAEEFEIVRALAEFLGRN